MKLILNFFITFFIFFTEVSYSQVGIGTTNPDASSILDVTSNNQGFLFPRLTTINRNVITLPAKGLTIFNTTTNQLEINVGTPAIPVWIDLGKDSSGILDEPWFNTSTNTAATSNTQNIYQLGNVGIGTTTPSKKLSVVNGSIMPAAGNSEDAGIVFPFDPGGGLGDRAFIRYYVDGTGENTKLMIGCTNDADDEISFWQLNQERMTFYNGRIGILTGIPSAEFSVNGNADKPGGGTWATFSDERVKKNINSYNKGLKEILAIRPVTFEYNGIAFDANGKTYVGVIAQEIEKVLPSTVTSIEYKDFNDLRQFDSSELTYTLINAIKELKAEIDSLKLELKNLKKE